MHHFQLLVLVKLCRKHGLDLQLIDATLTYYENKKYLLSLIPREDKDLLENGKSQIEWYKKEHFLTYYLSVRKT